MSSGRGFWVTVWRQNPWLQTCFATEQSFYSKVSRAFHPREFKIELSERFKMWAEFQGRIKR
jgi:hypothetical protein